MYKEVDYIPVEANFALAEEWEEAITAAMLVWMRPSSIGDRRIVIDMFNAMLMHAPSPKMEK